MNSRLEVMKSVLEELQDATEYFGLDELYSTALRAERELSAYPLPQGCMKLSLDSIEVDPVARGLYPEDAPRDMLPLVCKGEGNHLFDAASVLLFGDCSLSLELQLRTTVEMLLHKQYYLKGMIDSKVMLQAARFSLCTEESAEKMNLPMAVLEAIFDADIKATCFPGTFANMWHIYALASVLYCNIYSIYPMSNLKIRPYFNRLIRPRTCLQASELLTLHIMWSGDQLSLAVFKPQYFVPVIPTIDLDSTNPDSAVLPVATLELLNTDPEVTYSSLRDRYSITKSTFYRWKRQSKEHRRKAASRYEAKHVLQSCLQAGSIITLQHFKKMFPDISRSTYYSWKHEMLQSSMDGQTVLDENSYFNIDSQLKREAEMNKDYIEKLKNNLVNGCIQDRDQAVIMQDAKKFLWEAISLNNLVPYRNFKRSFPGISRSTYYNWRREAIRANPNFQFSDAIVNGSDSHSIDKSPSSEYMFSPVQKQSQNSTNGQQSFINHFKNAFFKLRLSCYERHKKIREEARKRVQKWKMPFCLFRAKYPSISCSSYWFWMKEAQRKAKPFKSPEENVVPVFSQPTKMVPVTQISAADKLPEQKSLSPYNATISGYSVLENGGGDKMFVQEIMASEHFKAKAKLFLQERYLASKFPTYKEFRAHFPFTPRSTYYMWKRALFDGMVLVDA
ncbi:vertnin [Protopterus annectens]|uniref:vertnin n=1 Tax=Protopterus annectens TaxID=7888 RepID=UPI001CFBC08F|nr:vertnin [Protopterus annectens]XP_043929677.1 vertnin [Protopterus annectens]